MDLNIENLGDVPTTLVFMVKCISITARPLQAHNVRTCKTSANSITLQRSYDHLKIETLEPTPPCISSINRFQSVRDLGVLMVHPNTKFQQNQTIRDGVIAISICPIWVSSAMDLSKVDFHNTTASGDP